MSFLKEIITTKKEEISNLKKTYSLKSFEDFELFHSPHINFRSALEENSGLSIIAEIKKASPSKGVLKEFFDHLQIADIYMQGSASAISVLTDQKYFMGNISFIKEIAAFKRKPVLRKDFILDPFQIYETKANGADAVLLISEILTKDQIDELTGAAHELGLEVLLEIHSEFQINKINFEKNKIIGINNRDLHDFKVDINATDSISKKIPAQITLISESGINSQADIKKIMRAKVNGVLVGEYFMKSSDIKKCLEEFSEWCKDEN